MGNPAPPSWDKTLAHYSGNRKEATAPPVYSRDFAYANNGPVVLAHPMRSNKRGHVNGATSAKTFAELLSGPTVDIYVGKERKHWSLHRNLLCHHSSYFETEFEGHEVPKEDKDGKNNNTLELLDDDPRGFELLVKWLYQGQLEDASILTEEQKYDYAVACHKLYMLCDKFDMKQLKNIAIDQYRANLHAAELVPDADEINEIYRVSSANNPFRRLMTKIAARQIMDPEVDKDAESYRACFRDNPDFAVEMINAIRYMSGGMLFDDPTEGDEDAYHDHTDGSSCVEAGKGKGKAKVMVNGTGTEAPAIVRRQLPAELSAERRTPRKLDIRDGPKTPTPNPPSKRSVAVNGSSQQAPKSSNKPKGNTAPPQQKLPAPKPPTGQTSMANGDLPHPHRAVSNPAQSQTSSVASGPRKLSQGSLQPAQSSVLGKRGGGNSKPSSVAGGPRKLSHNVNGIVKQFDGVADAGGAQSQGGAQEISVKKAPPKLRQASHGLV